MSQPNTDTSLIFVSNKETMPLNAQTPHAIVHAINKLLDVNVPHFILSLPFAFGLPEALKLVFDGLDYRDLYIMLLSFGLMFFSFTFVFFIDFLTGIAASKKIAQLTQEKEYIKSDRLWRSIWKLVALFSIIFPMALFGFLFYILEMKAMYYSLNFILILFVLLAVFSEIHSIGENIKKLYDHKPKFFDFFDMIAKAVEKLFVKKIDKLH